MDLPNANVIEWGRPMLERFKVALASAPGNRDSVFTFEGNSFVKGYAAYLIEHLETIIHNPNQEDIQ